MQKFYTTRLTEQADQPTLYTQEVQVYLASEVDARIAEMEAQVESLQNKWASRPLSSEDAAMRIAELEAALLAIKREVEGCGIGCTREFMRIGLNSVHGIAITALSL